MPAYSPIPVTLLTGFLGAGKTTLLNRLLRDPALADTAVLVNEFGEIGLDHQLVEAVAGDMILLSSGCLCCTVRGDLVSALEGLLERIDDGGSAIRRVVIETTGLADPAPILHTLVAHPALSSRFRLDGVVTLVDAVNGMATLDVQPEAVKQAAVADRIVLTKTDLLSSGEGRLDALRQRLRRLNPGAPFLDAAAGEAAPSALLEAGPWDPSGKIADVAGWLNAEAYATARGATGHEGHDHGAAGDGQDPHDVARHDDHIRSFSIVGDAVVPAGAVEMFLILLTSTQGHRLLRLKGLVAIAEEPGRPLVVHAVQSLIHPPALLADWPDEDRRTRLVFIVRDLDPSVVRRMWDAFMNVPSVDTPDRAALTENPLALPRGNA
jgi:G3E family GTPase